MTENKKRLLILTPRFPYPVIGGDRLRIYQVCKALSKRFSLTLLSLCETEAEMVMPLPNDGVFDRIERVYLSRNKSYLNTLLALPTKMPLQVAYYKSLNFAKEVERLMPDHDGVLCHLIRCAEYVKGFDKPSILEMTDAISLNYSRLQKLKNVTGLRAIIYSLETRRLFSYEKQIIDNFDLTILVSEKDKDHLLRKKHNKVMVCSNGVALDNFPFCRRQNSQPVIVYIGNMLSLQNMDACLDFAKNVMPLVTQKVRVTFRVVGRITDIDAAKLRTFENVEVTGLVEDIGAVVADARIGVCPVRLAAGVQNKILEYMALGLPVVTSSIGLEGINAKPDQDLMVANTPKCFADLIIKLFKDDELRKKLAHNAKVYIEKNHNWDSQLTPYVDRVVELIKFHGR